MPGHRTERLAQEIRDEVAQIVDGELKDPRLGLVTVTRVALSSDLRTARVMVGVLAKGPEREQTLRVLRQAAGFVRRQLGRRLTIRHTPEIVFQYDAGYEATERVARLLDESKTDSGAADVPEPAGHDEDE